MSKQACKCKETECEECPEWIFTLADLIMCMMGLFVILWVLKPGMKEIPPGGETEELTKVVAAIREAFGYIPDPKSNDPIDVYMILKNLEQGKTHRGDHNQGDNPRNSEGARGKDEEVTTIRPGPLATVGGRVLFERGSTQLTPEGIAILDDIAIKIQGHRTIVQIKGHAGLDDFEDGTSSAKFMDLSLRRAQAVQDYLAAGGVYADTLRVQGCSTFEPVNQKAYDPTRKAANRRVEIEETSTPVAELQDTQGQPPKPLPQYPPKPDGSTTLPLE